MTTIESNKLIAEFMGKEIYQNYHKSNYHISWDWLMPVIEKIESKKAHTRFVSQWNEFNECTCHQVIIKIEEGEMSKDRAVIYDSKTVYEYISDMSRIKIKAAYEAVVQFIQWYNEK